jgi:microsomal dipeptidase-like Zn-dependent dipeptidase
MPQNSGASGSRRSRPATTPDGRESQLIALAYDLVEKRIRAGNATSQETTHFLKLGSSRERLEQQRIFYENQLTAERIKSLESQQKMEDLYRKALNAMSSYQGRDPEEPEDEYED